MFTGIVEELGRVVSVEERSGGARLVIAADAVVEGLEVGASVAVNGCCLTAVEVGTGEWAADAVIETLRRTNLGGLQAGDAVNLERPLPAGGRLDGHIVQGHVDATGVVRSRQSLPDGSHEIWIDAPGEVQRYVVEKGSVTVDGVSLTVAGVDHAGFAIAVIPHTAAVTTLGSVAAGAAVNLEADVVAKYVERLVSPYRQSTEST